jgi:hypothetical protein
MLSIDHVINILNNLPQELVSLVFNHLSGIDMVNFVNKNELYIPFNELNIKEAELNVWNLMKNSKDNFNNKLFEWCKILHNANISSSYYKLKYEEKFKNDNLFMNWKTKFAFSSNKEHKYSRKLYIGLFLNTGLDIKNAYHYSDLPIDKINMIFNIMKELPDQLKIEIVFEAINITKEMETIDTHVNYAIRINKIYHLLKDDYITNKFLRKAIMSFPDEYYQRFVSLLEINVELEASFNLSNPTRKFTDELIDKFKQLKEELNVSDDLLVSNLRNNNVIEKIRYFKSKNITSSRNIDYLLNRRDKDFLNYMIKNNKMYNFDITSWSRLGGIYENNYDLFQEIFTKFTIKQQNNLRIKKLMEDDGYDELYVKYIDENLEKIYIPSCIDSILCSPSITMSQFFQVYTELTEFQMKKFIEFLKINLTFDEALQNTYQIVEY